ncbi:CBS domain-containing protein [Desulfopila inferna]|uniref:CBS domain-containing protein n=1 Tax=Desulfopila inferna TaxID=468528 RepID=UPI0019660C3E|nr:CBS domain-containing protein [Desulfopila inferna]MBM9605561.1 CBS domain-containing protein [Desulfopila inferna]
MQIITTHLNADFDGLASMIAAKKLYPEAIMAFSGSQEKNVRDFIGENLAYRYDFQKLKSIDLTKVTQLIVVDNRSSARLGPISRCLENKNLSIHIYDHHPKNPGDMVGELQVIEDVGSTATILMRLLKEKNIEVTEDEATIFCLGIYEDTGSLTHTTTTPQDLRTVAWLLEKGAKLDLVSQFITYELTTQQVQLLGELMKTANSYVIQNIPIVVVTLTLRDYIDDFALIVRRFMNMENLDTLFALISMAGRIYLIARSRIPDVNVGLVARDFGGGGHASAASATVRNMTLIEAQEKLIMILHRHVRPQPVAEEMMSRPVITIPTTTTIAEAKDILTRYNITVLPVVPKPRETGADKGQIVAGTISRRVVEKAIHHDLGHLPVSDYMTSDIETLPLKATLADIQELIIEHRQRLLPVIHENKLVGIITRTDLLNRLVNDPANMPKNLLHEADYPSLERTRNLNSIMVERLGKGVISLLRNIGEVADVLSFKAYAVGGFVRDLLLKKPNFDLDIVIEGEGIEYAKALAARLGGRVIMHERFATAKVLLPDGMKIDIATARLEYYEYPAALPTIELSSLKLDLFRRDFTINAMAVQLNSRSFGTLNDFFNCQNDLKYKSIKVLHNLSFVEDPTRIFRAIRLEKRMDFTIAKHTERLMRNAVKMELFGKADDPRFFTEIKIILSEEDPIPAIERLAEFDLFRFLWPDLKPYLKIDRRFHHILTQAHRAISWFKLLYLRDNLETWMVYLLAIMGRSGTRELQSFCTRFNIPRKISSTLILQKERSDKVADLLLRRRIMNNSELYWIFEELSNESLLYLMAIARKNHIKRYISNYVTTLRQVKPFTTGKKLEKMGYTPGPLFKLILNDLLSAKLDNLVQTERDERAFLREHYPL